MPTTKYVLHYFPVYSRGESIRQLLILAGQDFEDRLIPTKDWPKYKNKYTFQQVPVLEENGRFMSQEYAINRYLARKYGLAGKTEWEQAEVDALADQFKDFFSEVEPYFMAAVAHLSPGNEAKLYDEVWSPAVRKHMPYFVQALERNGSGFLVGQNVTWLDLMFAEKMNIFAQKDKILYYDYPALQEHRDKVHSIPRIRQWRQKRFQSTF